MLIFLNIYEGQSTQKRGRWHLTAPPYGHVYGRLRLYGTI